MRMPPITRSLRSKTRNAGEKLFYVTVWFEERKKYKGYIKRSTILYHDQQLPNYLQQYLFRDDDDDDDMLYFSARNKYRHGREFLEVLKWSSKACSETYTHECVSCSACYETLCRYTYVGMTIKRARYA